MVNRRGLWQLIQFVLLGLPILACAYSLKEELEIVYNRRVQSILAETHNSQLANQWRNELTAIGNWTDVDYTAGCPAGRADWPAQDHFHRIITMSSAWHQDQADTDLLKKISLALDYWFERDFTEDDCINAGGNYRLNCSCGTPGFWNRNWYYQMILIPGLVGNACLLLKSNLSPTQVANCSAQTSRSFVRIDGDPNGTMGPMTGANMLDVSSIGVSLALFTDDQEIMLDSIARYYNESQLTVGSADGIKVDGSFMQHSSQLYTGNYGSVFMRGMLTIFMQTSNTSMSPPPSVQSAYLTLINGSEWFIYLKDQEQDPHSPILSWQFSVIGRMVSHRYEDWWGIELNLDDLVEETASWDNHQDFQNIVERLRSRTGVNPGPLVGTRFFHTSDYLVHRGANYIVALKMFSSRTTNSECNNGQNPFGFHLSDGVIYSYLSGNEYTNVYGAWDWNLIPGSTVDYEATPLSCNSVQFKGVEPFVGGAALEDTGLAVMNYTNPSTSSLHWLKTYFFFPNSYAVQFVGGVQVANSSTPVVTTLDQRQLNGPIYIDGQLIPPGTRVRRMAQRVWHDNVGYETLFPVDLTVDTTPRRSDWAAIGISVGNETQNLFAAYINHPSGHVSDAQLTYIASLNVDLQEFERNSKKGQQFGILDAKDVLSQKNSPSAKTAVVRGAYFGTAGGIGARTVSLAFLTSGEYDTGLEDITAVETDAPLLLIFKRKEVNGGWRLAVSDPSQSLTRVNIVVHLATNPNPINLAIELPSGAWAGSTTVSEF